MRRYKKNKSFNKLIALSLLIVAVCYFNYYKEDSLSLVNIEPTYAYKIDNIPEYSGQDYIEINDNIPDFDDEYKNDLSFEMYSELDSLGRCGEAFANLSIDSMPDEERGSIGSVKPTGWQTIKYDFIEGKYLFNRCHLIGYQLSGENANEKNLITCTRQMNIGAMLEFENLVSKYIKETHNHVLYRVTPIFEGKNLLSKGVQMEAYSVEDNGKGIKINVFVYNVQKGVKIDYLTGESTLDN